MAVTPDNPLGMGPSAKLGEKPAPDFRRPRKPEHTLVTVWDPEGNPHQVKRVNYNDAISREGWSARAPKAAKAPDDADDQAPEVENSEPDQGVSPEQTELDQALDAMNALRAEASELGVNVDQRWGKKRLATEIAKAKAAQ